VENDNADLMNKFLSKKDPLLIRVRRRFLQANESLENPKMILS